MIKKVSTKPSAKTASKATGKGQSKKAASAKQAETKAEIVQDDLLNEPADKTVLDRLYDVVLSRKDTDPSVSHSARLLSRGT